MQHDDFLKENLNEEQNKTYNFIKEMAYLTGVSVTPKRLVEIAKKTLAMEGKARKNIKRINFILN